MPTPIIPSGNFVLPVCINDDDDVSDLLSALDLYRVMRKKGESYPAMDAIISSLDYADNPEDSPCFNPSLGNSVGCYRMDTSTEIFKFYPNDPFNSEDTEKTSLNIFWTRFGDIIKQDTLPDWLQAVVDFLGDYVGYFENDCFMSYINPLTNLVPDINDFWNWISNVQNNTVPFPSVEITLVGAGQMEVELCQMPFGGRCLIWIDDTPSLNDIIDIVNGEIGDNRVTIVELQQDLLSTSPEIISTTIVEIEFEEDTEHIVRCYFVPSIEVDQAPFVFQFGGIREIEFCGNLKVIGSQTGNTYDKNNYKTLDSVRQGILPMTTYEDLRRAVKDGTIDAWQLAVQARVDGVLSGDIEIDRDGIATIKNNSKGVTPVDGTQQQLHYGASYNQAREFTSIFKTIDEQKANSFVDDIIKRFVQTTLDAIEDVGLADLVGEYLTYKTSNPDIDIDVETLALKIFCGGFRLGVLGYATQFYGTSLQAYSIILDMANKVSDDVLEDWYSSGYGTPRDGYQSAVCYRLPDAEVIFSPMADDVPIDFVGVSGYANLGGTRLIKISSTGYWSDEAGNRLDACYYVAPNGSRSPATFQNFRFDTTAGGSLTIIAPQTLPFSEKGEYSWIVELPANNWQVIRVRENADWFDGASTTMKLKIQDLGQA